MAATSTAITPSTSAADDTLVDEVKVFRTNDGSDDTADVVQSTAELKAEKKDLDLEDEIESQTEPLGQRTTALNPPSFYSPSFPFMFPTSPVFATPAIISPLSPLYPTIAARMYQFNQMAAMTNIAAAAAAAMARSPSYMQQFAGTSGTPFFTSPFANGLVGMGLPNTASSLPKVNNSINSPMVGSMTNVLGGISLSAEQRKAQRAQERNHLHHQSSSDSHRIHKREKREKRDENHERIKKPMNAYMLFMKKNREKFLAEHKDRSGKRIQSADLNKIMGEAWQKMDKAEQQPYYDEAKQLREDHQSKYPNWTARRDNYAIHKKNKKKRREKSMDNNSDMKKCRARFGVDNQDKWCKHCKRKKRCLNVRDADSPVVSSTTNPTTPSSTSSLNQNPQMQGTGGQFIHFGSYHDSPSCSTTTSQTTGTSMSSVGKRSESVHSSASSAMSSIGVGCSSSMADETLVQHVSPQINDVKPYMPNLTPISNGNCAEAERCTTNMDMQELNELAKPTPTHSLMNLSNQQGSIPHSAFQLNHFMGMSPQFNQLMMMNAATGGAPGFLMPNFGMNN